MLIIIQLYLVISLLFLAGKDAMSYKLKANNNNDPLSLKRIKRWHRDGAALYALYVIAASYIVLPQWWIVVICSLLIRLAIFDLAFNKWASLDMNYLGSTAEVDKFFIKIFGKNGAKKKSLFFLVMLIILNIIVIIVG